MKSFNERTRLLRKVIAVFLAIVMTAGLMQHMVLAERALSDGLIGTEDLRGVYRNITSEHDEEYLMSIWHDGIFEEFDASIGARTFQNQYSSPARQNYFLLLTGNYRSVEIPGRFAELFGYMSPDYILQNYTTIFDISK